MTNSGKDDTKKASNTGKMPLTLVDVTEMTNTEKDAPSKQVQSGFETPDNVSKTKLRGLSRIVDESASPSVENDGSQSHKLNGNIKDALSSTAPAQESTAADDKQREEKKRLENLEQQLSQKLRQSNSRKLYLPSKPKRIALNSGNRRDPPSLLEDKRSNSDSERTINNYVHTCSTTALSPLAKAIGNDTKDGFGNKVSATQSFWSVFKDNNKLENIKKVQVRTSYC